MPNPNNILNTKDFSFNSIIDDYIKNNREIYQKHISGLGVLFFLAKFESFKGPV